MHTMQWQGRPKVDSAEDYLRNSGYKGRVEKHHFRLDLDNICGIASEYDVVVDASDTFRSKFMINDACVLSGIPYVHAGVLGFEGQLMKHPAWGNRLPALPFRGPAAARNGKDMPRGRGLGPAVGYSGPFRPPRLSRSSTGIKTS